MTNTLTGPAAGAVDPMATPANATTGAAYKGGNVLRLLMAETEHGYSMPDDLPGGWAGYRQWLTVGRQVRKGEHGTACQTVVVVPARSGSGTRKVPRGFRVFHYAQTDAVDAGTDAGR